MIVIGSRLKVEHLKDADLDGKDAWTITFSNPEMSMIGHNHSQQSAMLVNEKVREELQLPSILELTRRWFTIKLIGKKLEDTEESNWLSSLWSVWREDKENSEHVFLTGLERHEYIEYDDDFSFESEGSSTSLDSIIPPEGSKLTFKVVAKKKAVHIAYFSSQAPSGSGSGSVGAHDEPRLPSYSFALSVTEKEYEILTGLLEQPVVFQVQVGVLA